MRNQKIDKAISLLETYPRTRPPLTKQHEEIYLDEYKRNRSGSGIAECVVQKLESWMHRQISQRSGETVLELGAGTLNHLPFEPNIKYYDIIEPLDTLYQNSPYRDLVRNTYFSLDEIPTDFSYDRIISIAVLEHMTNFPAEIARAGLLLNDNGYFQAGIPNEGGFLWWLAWRCGTGVVYYLRTGLDYGVLMRHEHVNKTQEIIAILRYFFRKIRVKMFPINTLHLGLYSYVETQFPGRDKCIKFLYSHQSSH